MKITVVERRLTIVQTVTHPDGITDVEDIDHSAEITLQCFDRYMRERGWKEEVLGDHTKTWTRAGRCLLTDTMRSPTELDFLNAVRTLARIEGREPHLVLADIAALVEPKTS